MDLDDSDDEIKQCLELVAQKLNMNKWRYVKKGFDDAVVNFICKIVPVVLIDVEQDIAIDLIIKVCPKPVYAEYINDLFKREVCFYTTWLPIVKKQKEIDVGDLVPECYYAVLNKNKKMLVLNDVTTKGFKRYTNGMFLDHEHVMVTLQAIAKFHAISMISQAKHVILPEIEHLRPFGDKEPAYYVNSFRFCMRGYSYLIAESQYKNDMKKLCNYSNSPDLFKSSVEKAKCLVYAHGDLWKENILFKYSGTKPAQVCLLDYQLTHLMSPAAEVLFFIMNSTDSSVRRRHFKCYVSTYYQTLRQTLRTHGLDADTLYPEEDLYHDMRLVFPLCFSWTFMSFILWLELATIDSFKNETITLPDISKENTIQFKNIIQNLLTDFKDLGIFTDNIA